MDVPANISAVDGDLLDSTEQYICQQCNCLTTRTFGLSAAIAKKYPYANIYRGRKQPDIPGTIKIVGNGHDQRYIICMLAQYNKSKPNPLGKHDSFVDRQRWFRACLDRIGLLDRKDHALQSIAFPFEIGCGLAGGDWEAYRAMLFQFARQHPSVKIVIYRLS